MNRQSFLRASAMGLAAVAIGGRSWAAQSIANSASNHRLGGAWRRVVAGTGAAQDFVGVLALDWDRSRWKQPGAALHGAYLRRLLRSLRRLDAPMEIHELIGSLA